MNNEVQGSKEISADEHRAPAPDPMKVLPPVTEKQGRCLEFILNYFLENRYYPTQREVAEAMKVRSNTAEMYLQPLEHKGYLVREPGRQRRPGRHRSTTRRRPRSRGRASLTERSWRK